MELSRMMKSHFHVTSFDIGKVDAVSFQHLSGAFSRLPSILVS